MARGVLCPKCATVAAATAATCPKCGFSFNAVEEGGATGVSKKPAVPPKEVPLPPIRTATGVGMAMTLDDDGHKQSTRPFKAFAPDATFTDNDHDGATIEVDDLSDDARAKLGMAPKAAPAPPPKEAPPPPKSVAMRRSINSSPGRSIGPVPSAPAPQIRRSGALATHQAAVAAAEAAKAEQAKGPKKDPMTGEKLGEYVVEEKIGTGGMGVVYKAKQPTIGSTVAIKILRGDVIADKRDMERLLDEARVVNAIKHRGIISIFGAGELSDGRHYLVMEYLDGETLEKRLERVGQLTAAEAIPILEEVLAALAAAHSTGIVHRDLKPANIFLVKQSDGPDLVKLLDFGLARRQNQDVSRIAGTPDYISPEHARGRPAGAPADLYGFGVLCFHLLTGQLPFKGNSPMEMMEKHVHSPPPVPTEVNPSIPSAMSGLILALLEKDPAKRPDADKAKALLKAAGKQAQASEDEAPSPDGATPKQGRPALGTVSAEVDPHLKELARKADRAKLISTLGRNWPWILAGVGLLFLLSVVVWMLLTPTVPPLPKAAQPIPIPKKPAPTAVAPPPKKVEEKKEEPKPPPPEEPKPEEKVEAKAEPEVKAEPEAKAEPEVKAEPEAKAEEKPAEDPEEARKAAEKREAKAAAASQEKQINKWRLGIKNDLAVLDSKLFGELESYRPAVNQLSADVELVSNLQTMQSATERYRALKAKIDAAAEKLAP